MIACTPAGKSGSGDVLVRVYDKYLYASDLEGVIPPGASARDSLTAVRTFIQNWVDRELIVRKAEENLPEELQDFSDRIEEYRNSLVIFEYEKMLVRQDLDTNVSYEAIQDYYDRHKDNFVLKDYNPADSISPVQLVEEEIRKIILNKRKNDLIKSMRQTVLQDAIEHNQVEIF